jgi:hypothetical protein
MITQSLSYDLGFPLEVDDEYWETGNAETDFKQPDNVPSKLSCFTQFLKLAEIIAFAAKTLVRFGAQCRSRGFNNFIVPSR